MKCNTIRILIIALVIALMGTTGCSFFQKVTGATPDVALYANEPQNVAIEQIRSKARAGHLNSEITIFQRDAICQMVTDFIPKYNKKACNPLVADTELKNMLNEFIAKTDEIYKGGNK